MKFTKNIDYFTHEQAHPVYSEKIENNEYITETAGYIPLEVKFKQMQQNGIIAQFMSSDFTSSDYRDIYLNPDFDISPEDDFEDIQEKLQQRDNYIAQIKAAKSTGQDVKAGTEEPEKKAANAAETAKAES